MAVNVVSEEVTEQPRLRLVPVDATPIDEPRHPTRPTKEAASIQALAIMNALAAILGPRLMLVSAGFCCFILALCATLWPSVAGAAATGLFIAFVFVPVFVMALKRSV